MANSFYSTFINKTILIPRLQRDYVQGSNIALINDFVESLINSVFNNEQEDLNYIYGRWTNNKQEYIPIDGQQRLTTLWILHLYAHSAVFPDKDFNIGINFESREYAQDFCCCLQNHLGDILQNHYKGKICHHITNQAWFQSVWYKDRTVKSILSALNVINSKLYNRNVSLFYERLKDAENITFKFYKIDGKLNDDIYIKMNGRGLPLTDFELLKSWMDGKLEEYCNGMTEWIQLWQNSIDNNWMELIWKNRNLEEKDSLGNDISFLIDDEFLRFFYNLIIIYWSMPKANHQELSDICGHDDDDEQYQNRLKDIARILNMESDVDKEDFPLLVYTRLMERFRDDGEYNLPLYLLDKTCIFTPRLFVFVYTIFEELVKSFNSAEKNWMFNGSEKELNFFVKANNNKTIFHQIALDEKPTLSNLCLLYSLVKPISKQGGSATSFFDWMRVMRNLIIGTNITQENFGRVLNSIHNYSAICKKENIYVLLAEDSLSEEGSGFNRKQFYEEKAKAKWIVEDNEWISIFNTLENTAFCKGTIGFVFNYLPKQKDKSIFKQYSTLCHLLFGESGARYNIPKHNLQRCLMCYTTHYGFGYEVSDKWKFMDNRNEWHQFLNDSEIQQGAPHNACMKALLSHLYEVLGKQIDLEKYSDDYSVILNHEFENIIREKLNSNQIDDWRYYFIKYPSIWNDMKRSMCYWANEYDIVILGSTRYKDGNIRELRAFTFWRDIKVDAKLNPRDYNGWEGPYFWYRGDTCMFISHNCTHKRVVVIDLFYEKGKADQYRFRIFYRTNQFESSENTYAASLEYLKPIAEKYSFEFNDEDHKYWSPCYSYSAAMILFKELLKELSNN